MAQALQMDEIRKLSPAQRLLLVEDIWDSLADEPLSLPVTDAQREELDRRLEDYSRDPQAGSPWEEVRARLRAKT